MIGKKSQYEVNEVLPYKTHTDNVKKVKFYEPNSNVPFEQYSAVQQGWNKPRLMLIVLPRSELKLAEHNKNTSNNTSKT